MATASSPRIAQITGFLQILFSEGLRSQLSRDIRDFEMVQKLRVQAPDGRELRYALLKGLGPAGFQSRDPSGTDKSFPRAQPVGVEEFQAEFKEMNISIELPLSVLDRIEMGQASYADLMSTEMQAKLDSAKRQVGNQLYNDGLGVMGKAASIVSFSASQVVVQLATGDTDRGFAGWCDYDDLLLNRNPDATATVDNPTVTGTFYAWRVKDRSRELDQVTLEAIDVNNTVLVISSAGADHGIDAADLLYRVGQQKFADVSSVGDYGFATDILTGIESLGHNDGRLVNGMTMSGILAGSRYDVGNVQLNTSHLQAALTKAKTRVGGSQYAYKMGLMAPETYDSFVNDREADVRFSPKDDLKRGVRVFTFQHQQDAVEMETSEFAPKKRFYVMPEAKAGQGKVIEYWGTDFKDVKLPGMSSLHMKPSATSGLYDRSAQTFLKGYGQFIVKHPAALVCLTNFNIA